jgi:hypothetical protein
VTDPDAPIVDSLRAHGVPAHPDVVYVKDVLHHQTDPFGLLGQLLRIASDSVILRTRTRDVGETVTDPDHSCQYHYEGWMPYLVFNLQELIEEIHRCVPACELVVYRNHMVLGGRENRFLPKACYLPATGTAETAIGVFLNTTRPGLVRVEDRPDQPVGSPWRQRVKQSLRRVLS